MATNGPVAIQGCAYRFSRLNADGTIADSAMAMVQDDRPLIKIEAKPDMVDGVDITPISACGVPVVSYKDCDRYKRWDITISLGDWDPEQMELVGQGTVLTATGTAGRSFADGVVTENSNLITSAADASFVATDVGRALTDSGFTVATCVLNGTATITTSANFITSGIVPGMIITGTGITPGTVVQSVESATSLTANQAQGTESSETLTFHYLPVGAFVTEVLSGTEIMMGGPDQVAFKSGSGVTITMGAQNVATIGYQFPHLLQIACPFGISIEVWSKLIVRGTGFQGSTPYPSAGTAEIPGSAYVRTGIFRAYLWWDAFTIENKEEMQQFRGWAIENPGFGTGPLDDWRVSAEPGVGTPVDTTAWCDMMADFQLPSPLQPGYQTLPVA